MKRIMQQDAGHAKMTVLASTICSSLQGRAPTCQLGNFRSSPVQGCPVLRVYHPQILCVTMLLSLNEPNQRGHHPHYSLPTHSSGQCSTEAVNAGAVSCQQSQLHPTADILPVQSSIVPLLAAVEGLQRCSALLSVIEDAKKQIHAAAQNVQPQGTHTSGTEQSNTGSIGSITQ